MTNKWIPCLCLSLGLLLGASDSLGQTINYQGRIVGDDGNPINASWDVEVKVFGDEEGQEAIYTELISSVPIINGLYSFSFGADGVGRRRQTEAMGFGDAVTQVFNYTPNLKALAGTISVSDGSYSWSDSSGATDKANFIGSVNIPENNVSAIYRNSPPDHTTTIEVSFTYLVDTLAEVLTDHDSAFVQIKIGEYVFPREAFSFAPYSLRSKYSYNELKLRSYRPVLYTGNGAANLIGNISRGSYQIPVPNNVISKYSIEIVGNMHGAGSSQAPTWVAVDLRRDNISSGEVESIELIRIETKEHNSINFSRSANIDKWINSNESKKYTLSLYIQGDFFYHKTAHTNIETRGDISMRVNVTHN